VLGLGEELRRQVARVEGLHDADVEVGARPHLLLPCLEPVGRRVPIVERGVDRVGRAQTPVHRQVGPCREQRIDEPRGVADGEPSGTPQRAYPEAEVGRRPRREEARRSREHPGHRRRLGHRGVEQRLGAAELPPRADPRGRRDGADARPAVGERNEPEPTEIAAGRDDDLDVPFALALVAPGPPHLREERRAVQVRDARCRAGRAGQHGVPTGGVHHEARRDRADIPSGSASLHRASPRSVEDDARGLPPLAKLRAARPRATEEHLVELVARDLERVVPGRVERVGERVTDSLRRVVAVDEPGSALHEEALARLAQHADGLEHAHAPRQKRLAEVKTRMTVPLEHDDAPPVPGQTRGARRSGGPAADDGDVDGHSAGFGGGPSWIRSPMYDPMSVSRMPMPAKMR